MSIFKCKMCGGTLEISPDETVATCEYCGTQQTLPKLDDERRANLYDRANHFRRNNEFDKAMGIYEKILNEDNSDAEAYWSLVLCRYGIEYVEDPATHKRVPTVNRAQFTSIFDDDNYKSALKYADSLQRSVYEAEANTINEIQKGILAISAKEDPFDVFICYKESDSDGRRTPDSVLANELYHELTNEGFKVFFSRITLEDKLGTAYEPYIFAALNSAKVMVVLGTKPEYFNAVWVKNEWSRYLALIKAGQKKILIPAYKDMDPYDLPEEFSHLQAQDMTKLGFMQDLIRGIKKITQVDAPKTTAVKETVVTETSAANAARLHRHCRRRPQRYVHRQAEARPHHAHPNARKKFPCSTGRVAGIFFGGRGRLPLGRRVRHYRRRDAVRHRAAAGNQDPASQRPDLRPACRRKAGAQRGHRQGGSGKGHSRPNRPRCQTGTGRCPEKQDRGRPQKGLLDGISHLTGRRF